MTSSRASDRRIRWVPVGLALAAVLALAGLAGATGGSGGSGGVGPPVLVIEVAGQLVPTTDAPLTTATTAVPTTRTTTAPTTAEPTTRTTRATTASTAATTTTPATTTTLVAEDTGGTSSWLIPLLVILAIAALVAAVVTFLGMQRSKKQSATDWQGELRSALVDVDLTVDLAVTHSSTPDPRPFGQLVGPRLQNLHSRLDAVAAGSPSTQLRQEVAQVASGVQSFGFAAEAEWMLRTGSVPPSAEQLGQAGQASYERRAALDRSVSALRTEIGDLTPPRA